MPFGSILPFLMKSNFWRYTTDKQQKYWQPSQIRREKIS